MTFNIKRFVIGKNEEEWNSFLSNAKNQTFLFNRNFMDYHKDRFDDYSLMIYNEKGSLVACFPANKRDSKTIVSHSGLTYGGFILDKDLKMPTILTIYQETLRYYNLMGVESINLKCFPKFYNTLPSDEIDYALFLSNARLFRRDTAIIINRKEKLKIQDRRIRSIKKAIKNGIEVKKSEEFHDFYLKILVPSLKERFGIKPVHSLAEMELLMKKFPDNIHQINAYKGDQLMAGSTIFLTKNVVHAQYISASEEGRENGSLDYLFYDLINNFFLEREIFDFGICNENDGKNLNFGLLNWKEGFGGRSSSHDFYEINTYAYTKVQNVLI